MKGKEGLEKRGGLGGTKIRRPKRGGGLDQVWGSGDAIGAQAARKEELRGVVDIIKCVIYFFVVCLLGEGHTQLGSGLTPGSELRDYCWQLGEPGVVPRTIEPMCAACRTTPYWLCYLQFTLKYFRRWIRHQPINLRTQKYQRP